MNVFRPNRGFHGCCNEYSGSLDFFQWCWQAFSSVCSDVIGCIDVQMLFYFMYRLWRIITFSAIIMFLSDRSQRVIFTRKHCSMSHRSVELSSLYSNYNCCFKSEIKLYFLKLFYSLAREGRLDLPQVVDRLRWWPNFFYLVVIIITSSLPLPF